MPYKKTANEMYKKTRWRSIGGNQQWQLLSFISYISNFQMIQPQTNPTRTKATLLYRQLICHGAKCQCFHEIRSHNDDHVDQVDQELTLMAVGNIQRICRCHRIRSD